MKAGKIREDSERRFAALRFIDELAHGAHERGQALEDFGDAYDGNFGIISDDFNAGGAHMRPAHAEEGYLEALLQSSSQTRGVHVPGSFTCGEQKRDG